MEITDLYRNEFEDITLERQVRLPIKKLKHIFRPLYKGEKYKVRIGKIDIVDQLAAEKEDFSGLKPETVKENALFSAWILRRLIKKVDPYFDLTVKQLIKLMCKETYEELTKALLSAKPTEKKTELTEKQ